MKNLDWNLIKTVYENGKSLTKLSKELGITRWMLTKKLKELGVEIVNNQNKIKFDENVFDVLDNEEKSYWLGFIYADGYISDNSKCVYKNVFELSLKLSDINHLYKFNKFAKHINDNVKYDSYRCRWNVMNKNLWKVLNDYGCCPNKSLTLTFPNKSIFKDESLIRHFIRGYFDGDGCITYHKYVHTITPAVSILGTKDFLEKIIYYSKINANFRHDKRHSDQTFSLEYSKENAIKLINWLYSDCTIYLDRKYNLFKFFKNGSRSIQEWVELLSTKNGEICDDTAVVIKDSNISFTPYSVETETNLLE